MSQDTSGNVYINIPPLKPDKGYLLTLLESKKIDSENLKKTVEYLHKAYDNIENPDSPSIELAKPFYKNFGKESKTLFHLGNPCECDSFNAVINPNFERFKTYFLENKLPQIKDKIGAKNDTLNNINLQLAPCSYSQDGDYLKKMFALSQNCLICGDSVWEYGWNENIKKNIFHELFIVSQVDSNIAYGNLPLDSTMLSGMKKKYAGNLKTRILNLNKSISTINYNLEQIFYFENKYQTGVLQGEVKKLNAVKVCLQENYNRLNERMRIENDIKKLSHTMDSIVWHYEGFLQPGATSLVNTFTYGFETRSSYRVKADFGFLVYGNPWNNENFLGISPYFGFHVNFRPLNTEIDFRRIRQKGMAGVLSFTGGLLVASLEKEGVRKGIIDKYSFFTGVGIAFSHSFRLNVGSVWFKKYDSNPLSETLTPAATPYIGVSLDVRLKEISKVFSNWFQS